MKGEKEPKDIGIGLIPLIVLSLAAMWVGFAIICIIRGGAFIWLAVIAAAIVFGVGIAYSSIASRAEAPKGEFEERGAGFPLFGVILRHWRKRQRSKWATGLKTKDWIV